MQAAVDLAPELALDLTQPLALVALVRGAWLGNPWFGKPWPGKPWFPQDWFGKPWFGRFGTGAALAIPSSAKEAITGATNAPAANFLIKERRLLATLPNASLS